MRKSLLLSGLAFWFILISANAGIVEKTYQYSDFTIQQEQDYQLIQIDGLLLTGLVGEPALPYQDVKLMLPPGERAVSIEFIGSDEMVLPGSYTIYPQQPSRPLSEPGNGIFQKNETLYQWNGSYPAQSTGQLQTDYLNGYAIAISSFTPVKYNPATGLVSVYQQVKIRIETEPASKSSFALQNLSSSERIKSRVSRFVQNEAMMKAYPSKAKSGDNYDMLIITPAQFENEFQEIIDLYLQRGILVHVVTKEAINSEVSGQDLVEKIRNYIIDQYQNNGVEYILLGGDVEHVPYRGFYCYVESGSGYEDSNIPADLYYSALDGNWNDDNDNRWGEIGEDDLLPEIAVGRFSFSNLTELNSMIHKTTSYQDNPVLGEFNEVTLAGEWLYSNPLTYGSDYLELLIGYQNENGYETWGIPETYNYHKLYESTGSWSAADLRNQINSGRQFVHHVGHANSNYVAYMSNGDITNANFAGANGVDHNYTFFISHGCICGAFDDSDCIMEKMASIDNFAVAVIGNSRYGWFNEGQTEGPGAHLNREMVDAMYHEKINHLGVAFVEMKIQTAPWVTAPGQWEEGALRWNFYDINILGDPAVSVLTAEPISISTNYQGSIPIGVSSTDVSVSSEGTPMENFMCVVIKDGVIYGKGLTDASGIATITFDPVFSEVGEAQLVVSGYNCLPTAYDLDIIPNDGAYVIFSAYEIDDSQGNANGTPDYDEMIMLDLELENVGSVNAENVQVTISSADSWIDIFDDSENYGTIMANSVLSINGAFGFTTSEEIPDQHEVVFEVEATGDEVWNSNFSIIVNAPDLHIGSLTVNDQDQGNGNGILDPGEMVDIEIEMINSGHMTSNSVLGELFTSSPYLSISGINTNVGSLAPDGSGTVIFEVEVDESTPLGTTVDLDAELICGNLYDFQTFYLPVGLIVEDFETGDFTAYEWDFDGDADWTITNANPYEGTYAAKSGAISDQQESVLMISMDVSVDDEISFFYKVSSEASYDYLRFYIDNQMMGEWAGEAGWSEVSFAVTAGEHTFKWAYEKDQSVSNGSDCAWVDYITFPATSGMGNFLSVLVLANPDEVCEGESSQLNAIANGGSGSYSYSWEPASSLSDPTIANPVATPLITTTYSVTVDDGDNTIEQEITIQVNELPETPIITNEGDHLLSSASEGNQWYDSNGMIAGATAQAYYPTAADDYYVVVTNQNGCESEASNSLFFIYTGIPENYESSIVVYPNPASDQFNIEFMIPNHSNVNIKLMNNLGEIKKELFDMENIENGFYSETFSCQNLSPGIYFIVITLNDSTIIRKIVVTK
ncbi:MAG TPA: C25 family cysteine peptidase [Bacteroidales bacterium]|nr:C25 family cysteine peptidase [Bacteroidales bacterium]